MAIETYIIPSGKIVHKTRVDFTQRCLQKTLHVVQYDKSLPIVAVELFMNGASYTLPSNADVKVRWGKRDHSFVYKNILGCSEDRKTVYFDVDYQMVYYVGICKPILELIINGEKAGSSSMTFEIDMNPIQNGDVESSNEYLAVEEDVIRIKSAIPDDATYDNKLITEKGVVKYTGTSIKDADGNTIPEINNNDIVKESEVQYYAIPGSIVKRGYSGEVDIRVKKDPTYDDEPASKKYVDEHVPSNVVTQSEVSVGTQPNTIVKRDNDHYVDIRVHNPQYGNEPASKDYADGKMSKDNPVGTGSFSMNRKPGTASGTNSHAEGSNTTASDFASHAEGWDTTASGESSHAEGYKAIASGSSSHAEGISTTASGWASHVEGNNTKASEQCSHAEGYRTEANGAFSHTEGNDTVASNESEHASGKFNVSHKASDTFGNAGNTLFSVGNGTSNTNRKNALEIWQDGRATVQTAPINDEDVVRKKELDTVANTIPSKTDVDNIKTAMPEDASETNKLATEKYVAEHGGSGGGTAIKDADGNTIPEINNNDIAKQNDIDTIKTDVDDIKNLIPEDVSQDNKLADEQFVKDEVSSIDLSSKMDANNPVGTGSFSMNRKEDTAIGDYSHTEGYDSSARASYSHAEGWNTSARESCSHTEGYGTNARAPYSHAEGYNTTTWGDYSHAEGYETTAEGGSSHAEGGGGTKAIGSYSHAEGLRTFAHSSCSHTEGYNTTATESSAYSHAEGWSTTVNSTACHAEGAGTTASGSYSHAEGQGTKTSNQSEHASGQYNISHKASGTFGDSGNTLFSVGNGTRDNIRKNAFEIWQDGRASVQTAPINDEDVVRKKELDAAKPVVTQLPDGSYSISWNI